jgi:hypothetical protein
LKFSSIIISTFEVKCFKADLWSFGVTALELAHGRPPLSHFPPSKSLVMKIKQRFGFSDYDDEKQKKDFKNKNFSIGLTWLLLVLIKTLQKDLLVNF